MPPNKKLLIISLVTLLILFSGGCLSNNLDKEEARFEATDIDVFPKEANKGDLVNVSAEITNVGELSGNQTIDLLVNGEKRDSKTVFLEGNESTVLSYEFSVQELGNHTIKILDHVSYVLVKDVPKKVTNLYLTNKTDKVFIKWDRVSDADYYKIYRDNEFLESTENASFVDEEIELNKEYNYQVSVVKNGVEGEKSDKLFVEPVSSAKTEVILNGNGSKKTKEFYLKEGLYILNSSHIGETNYVIWLNNYRTNESVAQLLNRIGRYNGEKMFLVKEDGYISPVKYYFDVLAQNNWNITIKEPQPKKTLKPPKNFTGTGDTVTDPINFSKQITTFNVSYNSSTNFVVYLYNKKEKTSRLLINEIEPYKAKKTFELNGTYYLSIEATEKWRINIK